MITRFLSFSILFLGVTSAQAKIHVVDDTGKQIVLNTPAERIVSLAPHLTELLFSVGVGSRIVGTVRFSDFPVAAQQIPVLGDAFAVSLESIVALEPDLVVAWHSGGASNVINKLRALKIPVYVNEATDLKSIGQSVRKLGRLVGEDERGAELDLTFVNQLEELRNSNIGVAKSVFFQISDQSLYTVNDSHLIGQAMTICGVENIYGASDISIPIVSKESVLIADPDVIIISQPVLGRKSHWVEKWSEIEGFGPKVRLIDPALISRPSMRMLEGIKELCRLVSITASLKGESS